MYCFVFQIIALECVELVSQSRNGGKGDCSMNGRQAQSATLRRARERLTRWQRASTSGSILQLIRAVIIIKKK